MREIRLFLTSSGDSQKIRFMSFLLDLCAEVQLLVDFVTNKRWQYRSLISLLLYSVAGSRTATAVICLCLEYLLSPSTQMRKFFVANSTCTGVSLSVSMKKNLRRSNLFRLVVRGAEGLNEVSPAVPNHLHNHSCCRCHISSHIRRRHLH